MPAYRELSESLGRWPWTRRIWTELLGYISPGHPKLILFDILFGGQEPKADPGFASASKSAGNVILPFAFHFRRGQNGHQDRAAR